MDNEGFNNYTPPQGDPWDDPTPTRGETPYYRARDFRAAARRALKGFWTTAILVTFVAWLVGGLYMGSPSFRVNVTVNESDLEEMAQIPGAQDNPFVQMMQYVQQIQERHPGMKTLSAFFGILATVQFLIGGPAQIGYSRFKLHRLDGEQAELRDVFSAFNDFIEGLWMRVRMYLQILGWSLLFVIPGIVASFRYAMVPYLLADHPDMTVGQAFEGSKQLMRGRKMDLFLLKLSFLGWYLLSAVTLGIAALAVNPYVHMAEAAFYRNISGEIR